MYPDDATLTSLATLKSYLDPQPAGGISSIGVTAGGSGYTSAPAVAINDSTGTGATATAVLTGDAVTSINVVTAGHGYVSPAIVLSGGGGTLAAATATIGTDAALTSLITRASSTILNAANIPTFYNSGSDVTEVRNGNDRNWLVPKVTPIASVTSLTIKYQGGWSYAATQTATTITASDGTSAGYLFDADRIYLIGYVFPRGVQNITLVYHAGEVVGSQKAAMLEQACLVACSLWWRRRAHVDQASMAAAQGMGTISFTQVDLPKEAWTIINQVKRVVPVGP